VLAAAKEIAELKDIAEKTQHVSHGMMRFASGKMSSRKGNVITGESLLMDLKDAAGENERTKSSRTRENCRTSCDRRNQIRGAQAGEREGYYF
jgi:arginyl-tRNA synthetase